VPAGALGTYRVAVFGTAGEGGYTMRVEGATGARAPTGPIALGPFVALEPQGSLVHSAALDGRLGRAVDSHETAIEIAFLGAVDDTDIVLLYNENIFDDPGCAQSSAWVPWNDTGRLYADPLGSSQFFQRMAVDQTTGKVALCWYDTRDLVEPNQVRLFSTFTSSLSPLGFVEKFLVDPNEAPSTGGPTQSSLGDYTGIDFHAGWYFPAWANNSETPPSFPGAKADVQTNRIDVP